MTLPPEMKIQRSSRDAGAMTARLTGWLVEQLPAGGSPTVELSGLSDANGMSSETIRATVLWSESGEARSGDYVIRMAPVDDDIPVFPEYRLDRQFALLETVRALTTVPVPQPCWLEPTGEVLGAPFFFMECVSGEVPPDVMPYTFGANWLFDASRTDRERLQRSTIEVIAALHAIPDAEQAFSFLMPDGGRSALRRHVDRTRAWYDWAVSGPSGVGRSSALVERAFGWLDANWPEADRPDNVVLSWGDSRIGNVLYRDFQPVGVLDWEMAGVGPRELDLAWLVFAHEVFQGIARTFELPGLPDFLREEDVITAYREASGVDVGGLAWFRVYSALQWGIVFVRTGARQAHFGEIEMPEDPDSLMHHAAVFSAVLDEVGA